MQEDFRGEYDRVKGLLQSSIIASTMGQADVLEFFEKHPGNWHTSQDIRQFTGGTLSAVTGALKKLRSLDLVEYKEMRNPCITYLYKSKE